MPALWQDLRYALRQLRKAPGFTLTALLTLSLTVGLAATVFSVFDALLIRPLPFRQPEQIVVLESRSPSGYSQPASWAEYDYWRRNNQSLSELAGYSSQTMNFNGPAGPLAVGAIHTTDNFFEALGVHAILGRTFLPNENAQGRNDVVVLSYALWQKNFNGSSDVIGAKVDLDGRPMTVIGVMPANFRFRQSLDAAYAPFRFGDATVDASSRNHFMPTIGRLKPGVSIAAAQADLTHVLAGYERIDPGAEGRKMRVEPIASALLGETKSLVHVLLLAVLAVLALGCVNIAGLMLARGVRRERELALRSAMGASRVPLARQLFAEIFLLAVAGTCGGAATAWALLQATRTLLAASLARGAEISLSPAVLLAALAAALCTLVLAGLLPARQLLSIAPADALRSGNSGAGSSRGHQRLGAMFIAAQMAMAMLLLLTSGLLLRSLAILRTTDLGFRTDHLLIEDVNLSPGKIVGKDLLHTYYQPLLEKVRAIPGVESAAIINMLPVQDYGLNSDVQIVGQPPAAKDREVLAELRFVTPDYYKTMGTRLLRGRLFDDKLETGHSQAVMVVNEAFVKKFFSAREDPIGKQIVDNNHATIIGVVSNERQSLYQPPLAEMDLPVSALPPDNQRDMLQEMQLVVRTNVAPLSIAEPMRHAMQETEPDLPFRPALTMADVVSESLVLERMEGWLFGTFAALGVLLAAIGLYGLIAQQVEQARRESGVRMALGAQRWQLLMHWMQRVATISTAGLVAGLLVSYSLRRVIGSILTIPSQHEAMFAAGLLLLMEAIALIAASIPAHRAASIDPMQALRAE